MGFTVRIILTSAFLALAIGTLAGPVQAQTHKATPIYDSNFGLGMQWPALDIQKCDHIAFVNAFSSKGIVAVVDGVSYQPIIFQYNTGPDYHKVFIWKSSLEHFPNGVVSSVTFDGADHVTCGPYTLLLPVAVAPTPVPTMGEWGMILMGGLLAGFAGFSLYRRRQAA